MPGIVGRTALSLVVLATFASCGGDAGAAANRSPEQQAPFQGPPVNLGSCPSPRPPAPIPDDFPDDIALPLEAKSLDPTFDLPNGVKVELHVPGEVKANQRYFIDSLRAAGRRIVAKDYEGWEAEVYFAELDGRPGLVQLVSACSAGTSITIEIFDLPD